MRTRLILALGALVATLASGCRPPLRVVPPPVPAAPALVRVDPPPALLDDGDPATLATALRASLEYYRRRAADDVVAFGPDRVSVARVRDALAELARIADAKPPADELARELARRFRAYRAVPPSGMLFTGYYLPVLPARLAPDARFRSPLLGRPPDLVTAAPAELGAGCGADVTLVGRVDRGRLVPYPTRAEIESGGAPNAPVLAWTDDPVALFFLQIQGTGRLVLADGSTRLVGFAASNGRPYASIGKLLVAEGQLAADDASMQGIRRWIAAHPEEGDRVLHANPRYVFLRPLTGAPIGSLGVAITAGRTIATDPAIYPSGALAFVRVAPSSSAPGDALSRLVLSQDAGAAIRGPGHVDVFLGDGADAEARAGRLRNGGELYFLAPRD